MNYQETLSKDLEIRRSRLQEAMRAMNVDACVLTTTVNVFYMTGTVYNGYFYLQ